jgi:hypothetical protein
LAAVGEAAGGLEPAEDEFGVARADLRLDQLLLGGQRERVAGRADEVGVLGDRDRGGGLAQRVAGLRDAVD